MSIFALNGSIDPDTTMDEDDVFNTKSALNTLGHFKTPKHGLTRFPDQPLIDGVKSFQRTNELRVDGVMKPDGPTAGRVDQRLAEKQAKEAEEKREKEQQRGRLEAELSAARTNRRAAHDRAGRKETEFRAATGQVMRSWDRVKMEGLKIGMEFAFSRFIRLGPISPPDLVAAVGEYNRAQGDAARVQQELNAMRNDVKDWDKEIRSIRSKLRLGS